MVSFSYIIVCLKYKQIKTLQRLLFLEQMPDIDKPIDNKILSSECFEEFAIPFCDIFLILLAMVEESLWKLSEPPSCATPP